MGIFEPLIEHSDGKPPEPRHPLDVVAPILVLLLAVVLLQEELKNAPVLRHKPDQPGAAFIAAKR